ncbi:hypothetical protein MFMK1_001461 [Metallumcola ferriviriculae]|uniref:Holin n=1 Tax=Metallumcola ferriviriculae TaxID=3039180 RepID=A0AAU0UN89_9FIRM|nr:hypothetical protein MFMK1_001461 [Desulfitibacteraceae bacterium MK1]
MFTYGILGTLAGAVTATVLVVEFLKGMGPIRSVPTRWMALAVAYLIIISTSMATGQFNLRDLLLYFLNSLLVAASALGSWEVLKGKLFG